MSRYGYFELFQRVPGLRDNESRLYWGFQSNRHRFYLTSLPQVLSTVVNVRHLVLYHSKVFIPSDTLKN